MVGAKQSPPGKRTDAGPGGRGRAPRRLENGERLLAVVGLAAFLAGTLPGLSRSADATLTGACLAVALAFAAGYVLRLRGASDRLRFAVSTPAVIDLLTAAPVPLALILGASGSSARLFAVLWALKLVRVNPAFALLARVLRNERQTLISVTTVFAVVVLFAATAAFLAERAEQPQAFGSVPAAIWWAVTTLTTTGYGDAVPATFAGRVLAGLVMASGIAVFALWAGILASGFSQELKRHAFLESWDLVVRLPFFRNLGAPALSEIAALLKVQTSPAGSVIVRKGQDGDSMFFIAEGEVEVRLDAKTVRLKPGQFFGEMALITGDPRNATVAAVGPVRLLRLDVTDFRGLAARQPELLRLIEAENARRGGPPAGPSAA